MSKTKKLTAKWSKKDNDIVFDYASKIDGRLLYHAFCIVKITDDKNLTDELESRGYDITTLRFSISKKQEKNG